MDSRHIGDKTGKDKKDKTGKDKPAKDKKADKGGKTTKADKGGKTAKAAVVLGSSGDESSCSDEASSSASPA